jgi:undecaprenyl-diphosphatase
MDWTIFHSLNSSLGGQDGGQDAAIAVNAMALFVLAAVAGALWFVARPSGSARPKIAAVSAAAAAGLALVVNVLLGHLWYHPRPFVSHPRETVLLVHHAADNSFPSDHASVAFAIAFAVIMLYRRLGLLLLVGAVAVGIDRIFVGVHYPLDVAASALVGLASALIVTGPCRSLVRHIVDGLSTLSDPVVGRVHDAVSRRA